LGKIFETLEPSDIDPIILETVYNVLINRASDFRSPIRAKAVRSLGKLAKKGFLNEKQKKQLEKLCKRVLGQDEHFEWDRAFIVRKEAKETLKYL